MANRARTVDLERLERAAARLTAIQREVLRLSAAERLSYDAIADRLGISHRAVEDHLADALYGLDRRLKRRRRAWWRFW